MSEFNEGQLTPEVKIGEWNIQVTQDTALVTETDLVQLVPSSDPYNPERASIFGDPSTRYIITPVLSGLDKNRAQELDERWKKLALAKDRGTITPEGMTEGQALQAELERLHKPNLISIVGISSDELAKLLTTSNPDIDSVDSLYRLLPPEMDGMSEFMIGLRTANTGDEAIRGLGVLSVGGLMDGMDERVMYLAEADQLGPQERDEFGQIHTEPLPTELVGIFEAQIAGRPVNKL